MDKSYIEERKNKKALIYRYKTRAYIASDFIKKYMNCSNPYVIDFGCADGATLNEIRNMLGAGDFIGIEYSSQLMSKKHENIKCIQGDITRLPDEIKADSADAVTALAVLEHLENPVSAISEAWRVLRRGGLLIITCPHPFWDKVATVLGLLKAENHEHRMDEKTIIRIGHDRGFELLEYVRFMFSPLGFLPYFNIPVSPSTSFKADVFIRKLRLLDFLFVNQCAVFRKP